MTRWHSRTVSSRCSRRRQKNVMKRQKNPSYGSSQWHIISPVREQPNITRGLPTRTGSSSSAIGVGDTVTWQLQVQKHQQPCMNVVLFRIWGKFVNDILRDISKVNIHHPWHFLTSILSDQSLQWIQAVHGISLFMVLRQIVQLRMMEKDRDILEEL